MRISDWSSDVCSSDLDHLNAPTIGMRLRYAQLLHQANIDDDVKVLVIRGAGDDFGTGQDLPEFMDAVRSDDGLLREVQLEGADRAEEHTSELQSLMRTSSAVFSLKKKKNTMRHST